MPTSILDIARSDDRALSRVQYALAISQRCEVDESLKFVVHYEQDDGETIQDIPMTISYQEKHPDVRRSSPYPFVDDVCFVAMTVRVVRDAENRPTEMDFGIATLDTRDLHRLPLGQDGKTFAEEIKQERMGRGAAIPARPLDDAAKNTIKKEIIQWFEGRVAGAPSNQPLGKSRRNIILVGVQVPRLLEDLKVIGLDPLQHENVVRMVSVAEILQAFNARMDILEILDIDGIRGLRRRSQKSVDDIIYEVGCECRPSGRSKPSISDSAHVMLHAIVSYAVCSPPLEMHFGFLKRKEEAVPGSTHRKPVETSLPKTASTATATAPANCSNDETGSGERPEHLSTQQTASLADAKTPKVQHSNAASSHRSSCASVVPLSGVSKDSTAASSENVAAAASVVPATPTLRNGRRAAMPDTVHRARTTYKRAGDTFSRALYEVAKPHCDISRYAVKKNKEYENHDGETETETKYFIKPAESYLKLTNIVIEKAWNKVNIPMLIELRREVAFRRFVDGWHAGLDDDDPRKGTVEEHMEFTSILAKTDEMLNTAWKASRRTTRPDPFGPVDRALVRAERSLEMEVASYKAREEIVRERRLHGI
ncbi:hypothetical protein LTR37_017928 [Vermiconidia calcicola]|uniref:Uncharacterized protein n=1 Tax=Vermiconidia calcicola TaxID=1690605 RepID=A0ACC3MIG9_9PEZI|nr:hypothetical protein LTR37_017928 [Vermiconidia calcicola]